MTVRHPIARPQSRRAGARRPAVLVGLTLLAMALVRPTRLAAALPNPTRLVAALVGLALLLTLLAPDGGSLARAQETIPWEPTGLGCDVLALFTPASGAFFALTGERLLRSDDAGETWAPVPLPPS